LESNIAIHFNHGLYYAAAFSTCLNESKQVGCTGLDELFCCSLLLFL